MGAFIKQLRETGIKATVIADGLGWVGNWYQMSGESANGVLDMIPKLASPEAKAWAAKIKTKFGYTPSPSSGGLSYDGIRFFIKIARRALAKYGKITRESIYSIIKDEVNTGKLSFTKKDGAIIMNSYTYTPKSIPDPVIGKNAYFFPVIQYEHGNGHVVFPADVREKGFIPPK
jgi:branched-chain amino acid transport system substrate-binding protein